MKVYVRFGASVAHTQGSSALEVTLADDATIADLLEYLRTQHPILEERLASAYPIISGQVAVRSDSLAQGQEVVFISALAGGSR